MRTTKRAVQHCDWQNGKGGDWPVGGDTWSLAAATLKALRCVSCGYTLAHDSKYRTVCSCCWVGIGSNRREGGLGEAMSR